MRTALRGNRGSATGSTRPERPVPSPAPSGSAVVFRSTDTIATDMLQDPADTRDPTTSASGTLLPFSPRMASQVLVSEFDPEHPPILSSMLQEYVDVIARGWSATTGRVMETMLSFLTSHPGPWAQLSVEEAIAFYRANVGYTG